MHAIGGSLCSTNIHEQTASIISTSASLPYLVRTLADENLAERGSPESRPDIQFANGSSCFGTVYALHQQHTNRMTLGQNALQRRWLLDASTYVLHL